MKFCRFVVIELACPELVEMVEMTTVFWWLLRYACAFGRQAQPPHQLNMILPKRHKVIAVLDTAIFQEITQEIIGSSPIMTEGSSPIMTDGSSPIMTIS